MATTKLIIKKGKINSAGECVDFPELELHKSVKTIVVKAVNCGKVANFSTVHSSTAS
jgi:hypothetical protein